MTFREGLEVMRVPRSDSWKIGELGYEEDRRRKNKSEKKETHTENKSKSRQVRSRRGDPWTGHHGGAGLRHVIRHVSGQQNYRRVRSPSHSKVSLISKSRIYL